MATQLRGRVALPDGTLAAAKVSFGDRISSIEPAAAPGSDLILPGLIDLQVNGLGSGAGALDVMAARPEEIARIAARLALEGTTGFLPTIITAPLERMSEVAAAVDRAGRLHDARAAAILGIHAEGPFIAPRRRGAHPDCALPPTPEAVERVLALPGLRLITLAPELPGAISAVKRFSAAGVVVSIGHTDAGFEQAQVAVDAGVRMFTHVFNAMRPMHHRDPGVVGAALTPSPAMAAVIADGVHIDPRVLALALRSRSAEGIILTSDRIAVAAEQGGGPLSRATVEDGAGRLAGGILAGATSTLLQGVRLMVDQAGASVEQAALMAASNPAKVLGLRDRGRIASGRLADLIVLDAALSLKAVFVAGVEVG